MNLKEAFRYQNKLQSFMDEAQGILDRDANVTKVENTYLRHKVMAEAEDETVLIAPETEYYEQITDIAQFLLYLLNEKDKLFAAIRTAVSGFACPNLPLSLHISSGPPLSRAYSANCSPFFSPAYYKQGVG